MSTDAIVVLKNDHKLVKRLFRDFETAGDNATAKKGSLVQQMIAELTTHTFLENTIMYPEVRAALPDLEDHILESYEEHHVADVLCAELVDLDPADSHFEAKVTVLIENVRHHIDEEEDEWFPQVRAGLGRKELAAIGERMQAARPDAPTDPREAKAVESARLALTA